MKRSGAEIRFSIANYLILAVCGAITLLPLVHVLSQSVSENAGVLGGKVSVYPIGFQLHTYDFVLTETGFLRSLGVSVFITAVGTLMAVFFSAVVAFPLSKSWLRGRKAFLSLFVVAMVFYPGIVPRYLLMRYLGLLNTVWVLIIPKILNIYYMILIKNYFEGLPEELEESARIDGASNLKVLIAVVIPIAKPIMATIAIFYAVEFWNNFFAAMMFITKAQLKPVQLFLLELIRQVNDPLALQDVSKDFVDVLPQTVRSAGIVLTIVPIMLVYPFLQRHFVKGLVIGSVKG